MRTPNWFQNHDRIWLVVSILVLVGFAPLAWLQYRWVDQVAEAERERMRAHLNAAVVRFGQDLDGELLRSMRTLLANPAGPPELELAELSRRWTEFSESGGNTRLVRGFYVSRGGEDGLSELYRFDPKQGAFMRVGWPLALERIRDRLVTPDFWGGPGQLRAISMILDRIPALVVPRVRPPVPEGRGFGPPPGRGPGQRRPGLAGWGILVLDLDCLQREFLPELTRRHLQQTGELNYQVRIVSRVDPGMVIYSSDASLPPEFFARADARIELLRLRPGLAFGFGRRQAGGPPELPEARGAWLLETRHRAGSLEAVVAATRRRNLAVSFAVFLVLAGAVAALLVSTRRAQRLARLQMEFVAGVSHELRTPLSVICSAADNLADGLVTGEPQVKRYGGVIRGEGRRLAHMVEQILGFAGLRSGRVKYDLAPADAGTLIERALAACAPELRSSGCEVEKEIEPDLPPVMADPAALVQCLRNLVDNALVHGAEGRWIGVRARRADARAIEIVVQDRGAGIDPADLPNLFQPFYRGRRSKEGQVRGFGLGLALVKRIVDAHSGTIEVSGAPGRGTAFALRIPAAPEETDGGAADSAD